MRTRHVSCTCGVQNGNIQNRATFRNLRLLGAPMASVPAFVTPLPSSFPSSRPVRYATNCASPVFGPITTDGHNFMTTYSPISRRRHRLSETIRKASVVAAPPVEETKVCTLPTWSEFELGSAPVYWKTFNGLPPTSGEDLLLFFNPAATNLTPNAEYGIAFNGGFNQPIMCGGEPRVMTRRDRGEADLPFYSITIRAPKHAVNLIFSFTNGTDWDGPYTLQFQVLKKWKNKPMSFFNEGLAEELSKEGACAQAIFPDSYVVIESCEIDNLYQEGGDRCKLDLAPGYMDPDSPLYDPLANVDDGSCPLELDSDEE